MGFLLGNWEWIMLGFYIAEKVVKVTPVKWDDILVDGVKSLLSKFVKP